MRRQAKGALAVTVAIASVALLAPPASAGSPRLRPFASCDVLAQYGDAHARDVFGAHYRPTRLPGDPVPPPPPPGSVVPLAGANGGTKKQEDTSATSGSSKTNVQEPGVDEPDIVKADGDLIFAIGGGALRAIDAGGHRASLVGSLAVPGWQQQLLLDGDRLLVIARNHEISGGVDPRDDPGENPTPPSTDLNAYYGNPSTELVEVDVSNPAAMRVISTESIDGRFVDARLVGHAARIVTRSVPLATSVPESKLVGPLASWVPYSKFTGPDGAESSRPLIESCGDVAHPRKFSGLDSLAVVTVDLDKGLPSVDSDVLLTDAKTVYASDKSLYLTTRRWSYYGDFSAQEGTTIHKFDTSSPSETRYVASGNVRGQVLNQFSMSENDGFLRVASTGAPVNEPDDVRSESFVSVLRQDGPQLTTIGRVGNLGPGERIRSVRMFGDTGYVVTYRQLDPLFTLDLSKPTDPRTLGSLEILGYSAYLHPIGDGRLIGVGVDATPEGVPTGALISLFDVSDPAHPALLARRPIPGGRTTVEDTHHAFLYWPPTKLAVVPTQIYRRKKSFSGALGFRIGRDSITQVARISHPVGGFAGQIERALVAGGDLYTLSCAGIEGAELDSFRSRGWLAFPLTRPDACAESFPVFF